MFALRRLGAVASKIRLRKRSDFGGLNEFIGVDVFDRAVDFLIVLRVP